ncbi:hypothetical protein CQ022_11000 [Chryseobacterium culicis]|uniref:Uncharacterized protein n=1 Tax=Chryseobacterium culicis TaxID=680127 RepID=A0A2S9D1W1_CHRCI|nr:hypothetical protein CQ022_11000 [Chryseobacterium culicis]PRB92502.1 hypothetical protein CQ033_04670 [Chryseobacterium culicis]
MRKIIKPSKKKRPPCGGLKNTNDEKNLFRKIQTEYCGIIQHDHYITFSKQKNIIQYRNRRMNTFYKNQTAP